MYQETHFLRNLPTDPLRTLALSPSERNLLNGLIKSIRFPHLYPLKTFKAALQADNTVLSSALAGMFSYLFLIAGDQPTASLYYRQAAQYAPHTEFLWLKTLIFKGDASQAAVERAHSTWEQRILVLPQNPQALNRLYLDTEYFLLDLFQTLFAKDDSQPLESILTQKQKRLNLLKNTTENIAHFESILQFSHASPFGFKLALLEILQTHLREYIQHLERFLQTEFTQRQVFQQAVSELSQPLGPLLQETLAQKRSQQLSQGLDDLGQAILALENFGHPAQGLFFQYQQHRQRFQVFEQRWKTQDFSTDFQTLVA